MAKQYWLMKSEPSAYSWDDLNAEWDRGANRDHPGQSPGMWDGVRNHGAAKNMRAMKIGDEVFFYHSQQGLEVVGIAQVVTEHYLDPTQKNFGDPKATFVCVDIKPQSELAHPVALKAIKAHPKLALMQLVRQSRLSVSAVSAGEWDAILAMARP